MNITPEVQQTFWAAAGVSQISDIPGFPLPNHPALKAAVASGEVPNVNIAAVVFGMRHRRFPA